MRRQRRTQAPDGRAEHDLGCGGQGRYAHDTLCTPEPGRCRALGQVGVGEPIELGVFEMVVPIIEELKNTLS